MRAPRSAATTGAVTRNTYPQPTAPNPKQVSMAFGQGPVLGTLHSETVRVNDLSTPNQSVVLINEHRVQGYCESSYDGVLGLGHRNRPSQVRTGGRRRHVRC